MNHLYPINGILFDLDGVLYVGSQVIDGATQALKRIRKSGIICRFITNTSTQSIRSLHHKLQQLGLDIGYNEIISAPQAALLYLRKQNNPVCHLLLDDDVKRDFSHFRQSNTQADYVIAGDIGDAWSYTLLNRTFRLLIEGAELIAIHKNRFWQTEEGLQMDIGGFIAALEYASGKQARIIGKPSPDFFRMALQDMRLSAGETIIIGDDIESDVGGGQKAGLYGILVKTGKYRKDYAKESPVKPDLVLDSVVDLPAALGL